MPSSVPSVLTARLSLLLAALLWSSGSFFMRLLKVETVFNLESPQLSPLQIAFFRGLFAGLFLLPMLKPRRDIRFRPMIFFMVGCFGIMSGLYLTALGVGPAANAILLQNTSPMWVYLIGVYILGHAADQRSWHAILVGMVGALVIVLGNWPWNQPPESQWLEAQILLMGAGSGLMYGGVVLFLRELRDESSAWLTVWNLTGSATLLALFVLVCEGPSETWNWLTAPSAKQLIFLIIFGAVQMAIPYWLFARGLKTVSPTEAGLITLLEPVLNPIWAYLISPETDRPSVATWIGGSILLGALAWRYLVPILQKAQEPKADSV
jgi:drug/metabolite transporter, DME family